MQTSSLAMSRCVIGHCIILWQRQEAFTTIDNYYYYYYLFTAIGFAPGGSGPYTTQLQQNTYNKNKYTP
jgi:hypothetical protein